MSEYLVATNELESIANSIRNKTSTSNQLAFPNEFISGINNIRELEIYSYINGDLSEIYNSTITSLKDYIFAYHTNLTIVSFPNCTSLGNSTFYSCSKLTTASFPNCTSLGIHAFEYCSKLTMASFPNCTSINDYVFRGCHSLTTVSFPKCTFINAYAFQSCHSLTTVYFPNCTSIRNYAFQYCYNLISLNLTSVSEVTSLAYSTAFSSTPIAGYTTSTGGVYGSIYVPTSLLASFKANSVWSWYSDRFVGV